MSVKGTVKNGIVVLHPGAKFPDGTEVEVEVHVRPQQALAARSDPRGSGQALLCLWDTPAQCTPDEVDLLLQAIDQGKRPVRVTGIFDQEDPPR